MEDYKEKYEAVLNRVKDYFEGKTKLYSNVDETLKYLFPELKESEDERIRKHLLKHFRNKTNEEWNGMPTKNILAWLEKQGEQKPSEYEKPLLEKFKQAVYDCAWGKVTCKKEGETQEEYAERWAEQFLLMIRDWADDYIDFTIQQKLRKSYNKGKENAIKENISSWSEEDEKILNIILTDVKLVFRTCGVRTDEWNVRSKAITWLKSLKERMKSQPKPHWKPSDKQMKQLGLVAEQNKDNMIGKELMSLYQDLKKLREE